MPYLDLAAIEATPLTPDPFDYLVVPDCVSVAGLNAANRDYPDIDTPGNKDLDELHYGPGFQDLIDELNSPALRQVISNKFNVDLEDAYTTITVRKFCEPSDGNIHTDHWSKVITVLVYFNTDWDNAAGQLRLLRSPDDIEDYAAEVAPVGGTLLAFRRTDISWHGHKRFVGERRMLQLNFVKTGRTARYTQQLARFSTRMMKRVARLVQ
ncbi:MAG: 2OG-Fe(II) oxygenase [Gammaproteobacteria bacterium]|nr:2OG-Fe(II) oxygenase [Gammaproteobacteria bacterium]